MKIGMVKRQEFLDSNLEYLIQLNCISRRELHEWKSKWSGENEYQKYLKPFLRMVADKEKRHTGIKIEKTEQTHTIHISPNHSLSLICEDPIGYGGMGQVFPYWDERNEMPVAVKFSYTDYTKEEQERLIKRLDQEGETLKGLNHPNIVKFYASGVTTVYKIPSIYLAMEYVGEGGSLKEYSLINGIVPQACRKNNETLDACLIKLLKYIEQIARALQYIHDKDLTHQDVKPENILIDHETAKLVDFGIAKRIEVKEHFQSLFVFSKREGSKAFSDPAWDSVQNTLQECYNDLQNKSWLSVQKSIKDLCSNYPERFYILKRASESIRGNFWDKFKATIWSHKVTISPEEKRFFESCLCQAQFCSDPKEDLYALGVTLYWCLTDAYPFGETVDIHNKMARMEGREYRSINTYLLPHHFSQDKKIQKTFEYLDNLIKQAVSPEPKERDLSKLLKPATKKAKKDLDKMGIMEQFACYLEPLLEDIYNSANK